MDSHHTPPHSDADAPPNPGAPFRHKAVAGLLAFLLGWAGAHWWYLGRRRAWVPLLFSLLMVGAALRSEAWYFHPAFFLFLVPAVAGFIEALVICLTPDAKFDARYNAGHARRSQTGWGPVLVAILTLAIGTAILMLGIVLLFQSIFDGVTV
ncbi:MAG: hypothetical protein QHC78_17905 [Pigmentiphaga sp.]|uniref:TM2 domain-containing protein n=1 Tax=Pigmentiphaga sp. TaxID=1977564 RepID=UPI0029B76982|nr:NINE protein [Pigmentiphaga sp.]MDX3907568.1 hypothetical protein [Pigmentiphaga sp.]